MVSSLPFTPPPFQTVRSGILPAPVVPEIPYTDKRCLHSDRLHKDNSRHLRLSILAPSHQHQQSASLHPRLLATLTIIYHIVFTSFIIALKALLPIHQDFVFFAKHPFHTGIAAQKSIALFAIHFYSPFSSSGLS
jgi:hypothetical protein